MGLGSPQEKAVEVNGRGGRRLRLMNNVMSLNLMPRRRMSMVMFLMMSLTMATIERR
jgi:hypothetical protein